MATMGKYLIMINLNHTMIDRVSGGIDHQKNQSNNNTHIRPYATEFIKLLYESGLFHLAFYSNMNRKNHNIITKILLQGSKTGMSIKNNITLIPGEITLIQLSNDNYYTIQNKELLIEYVNDDIYYKYINNLNSKPVINFSKKNTIIIDSVENNVKYDLDISILLSKWYYSELEEDRQLLTLKNAFQDFISFHSNDNLMEYISKYKI